MKTTTVILGAGQAGLAMSRCLADRAIDPGPGWRMLKQQQYGGTVVGIALRAEEPRTVPQEDINA